MNKFLYSAAIFLLNLSFTRKYDTPTKQHLKKLKNGIKFLRDIED